MRIKHSEFELQVVQAMVSVPRSTDGVELGNMRGINLKFGKL